MKHRPQENVPLGPLTTFGVGGAARFFTTAHSTEEVVEALIFAKTHSLPVFVLGGGSNIVVADDGFKGLVLALRTPGIAVEDHGSHVRVTVGAGVEWDDLVLFSIKNGFAGLECLSGVPGTVGGAVVANVGAYRAQVSDVFVSANVLDLTEEQYLPHTFKKEGCLFSYHDSVFSQIPGRYIVLQATFDLQKNNTAQLTYRDHRFDFTEFAATNGREPTLLDVRAAVLDVREQKGSLIMPGRTSYKCAGSIFHMPYVPREKYEQILARARELDAAKEERLRPWAWEQPDGSYKLAPGFLLEYTKFHRGYVRGGVGISPKHILSIINIADARARDIAQLARDMRDAVAELFAIRLEREVQYIGAVENEQA